jgi:molecular chaperone DnaJ
MSDHYETLGVARDATSDEIKKAYRKLVRELHPDVNPDLETQERFKHVTSAYEVLSDDQKRRHYDQYGNGSGSGFGGFGGGAGSGFAFNDIMDAFFGGGGSRGPRPRSRRGQDALIRIDVDLAEACFGATKQLSVETATLCLTCAGKGCAQGTTVKTCDVCKGRGEVQQVTRSFLGQVMTSRPCSSCQGYGTVIPSLCSDCGGDGRVRSKRTIDVAIPAGVETGNRLRLSGQGEVGPGGGPAGDLYVEIVQLPHAFIVRDGDNLHLPVSIPMTAAALGTTLTVDTLDGPQEVDVKPGTQSGAQLPLRHLGITKLHGIGRGDLIVHVEVPTPSKLDDDQVELLRKLAALRDEVRPDGAQSPTDHGLISKIRDAFSR